MSRQHAVDLYAEIPLFKGCTKKERTEIAKRSTSVEVEVGRVLCTQGSPGREAFVIIEGEASVTIDGTEVAMLGPGDLFGEMALLDGGPRVASVTAVTPMRLLALTRSELHDVLVTAPNVAVAVLTAVGRRLREAEPHPMHIGV